MRRLCSLVTTFALGCGSQTNAAIADDAAADATSPDDASTPDPDAARDNRCARDPDAGNVTRFAAPLDAGADATPRPPQIVWNGGAVLAHPVIVPVTFDGDPLRANIEQAVATIGCTSWWRAFAGDYGVGDAIGGAPVHVASPPPAMADDSDIRKWILDHVTSGALAKPDGNTVYALFYPEGATTTYNGAESCKGFYGYHDVTVVKGHYAPYMVVPRCGDLGVTTAVLSHELAEAATDPTLNGFANVADDDIAWELVRASEVADMCNTIGNGHIVPPDFPFTVQRIWSNRAAFLGQNPCVPADGTTWFAAVPVVSDRVGATLFGPTVTGRGVRLTVGSSTTIDVRLESTAPTGGWTVSAEDRGGSSESPDLTFSFDKTFGREGDVLRLTITRVKANATFGASPFIVRSRANAQDHAWLAMVGDAP